MRLRGRPIGALAAAAVLGWLGAGAYEQARLVIEAGAKANFEDSQQDIVYVLEPGGELSFDLTGTLREVRIVTNAIVRAGNARLLTDETPLSYALAFEFLDRSDAVLDANEYHHKTRLALVEEADRPEPAGFFFDQPSWVPLGSRTTRLKIEGRRIGSRTLRLSLDDVVEPVERLVVRLYVKENVDDQKLMRRWFRLPRADRERLASNNVFPQVLMRRGERRDLARQLWVPRPPNGLEFVARRLYWRDDEADGRPSSSEPPVEGVRLGGGLRATVPVPADGEGVRVRLELTPVGDVARLPEPRVLPSPSKTADLFDGGWVEHLLNEAARTLAPGAAVTVTWHRRRQPPRVVATLPFFGERLVVPLDLDSPEGGVLEVRAPGPVALGAFLDAPDPEEDPEIALVTTLPMQAVGRDGLDGAPLEYTVFHADERPTPFRVDLRRPLSGPETTAAPARVHWELLDDAGAVVGRGILRHPGVPSPYDRLAGDDGNVRRLSEVSRHYVLFPRPGARLRLTGETPVLAAVFNRPARLPRRVQLGAWPENANAEDDSEALDLSRSWFLRQPVPPAAELEEDRKRLVEVLARPPVFDPRIGRGEYLWESFLPEDDWRGHHLLVPRREDSVMRREARSVTFREVPAGEDVQLVFDGRHPGTPIRPTLLYVRETEDPFTLDVDLEDAPLSRQRLGGRQGEVSLPQILGSTTERRLRVTSNGGGRFFVNNVSSDDVPLYLRRFAFRFEGTASVPFEKLSDDPEVISIRVFRADGNAAPGPMSLDVRVPDTRRPVLVALDDWSFLERAYELGLAEEPPGLEDGVPVLGTRHRLDGGQALFVRLGRDLPAGPYRIDLRAAPAELPRPTYVTVSRLLPGLFETREFYVEREVEE